MHDEMFPPIPDAVLFPILDELWLPRGFWRRVDEEPSWEWCRQFLTAFLSKLPDKEFQILAENLPGATRFGNNGCDTDPLLIACRSVYNGIFKEVAAFLRIGPRPKSGRRELSEN